MKVGQGLAGTGYYTMTVEKAEEIILGMNTGVQIAIRHRFAGDKGTILRLDNYAMINIFDDGRYYIQGDNTEALVIAFGIIELAWDPDSWNAVLPPNEFYTVTRGKRMDSGSRFEF